MELGAAHGNESRDSGRVWFAPAVVPLLLACSGPCVQFGMMHADFVGWLQFAVTLSVALILSLRAFETRRFARLLAGWVCVALHPGWWLSAYGGDCGMSRTSGAALMTAATVALAVGLDWFRPFGLLRPTLRGLAAAGVALLVLVVSVVMRAPMALADAGLQECVARSERNPFP